MNQPPLRFVLIDGDPQRLEHRAEQAQQYVLATHSWDRVGERILFS